MHSVDEAARQAEVTRNLTVNVKVCLKAFVNADVGRVFALGNQAV